MVSYSEFKHDYINSFRYEEPVSKDYEVYVNGEKIPVYTCRVSKIPFNRAWPGHQREINQTEIASFVNIISDEKIDIKVVVNKKYEKITVRPFSRQIDIRDNNGNITFSLENQGQYVLTTDDFHNCLYIFNTKPINCDNPETVTHYFGPGVHFAGKITLNDNESVYVHKDALVFGCIYAENVKNIRVFGNGILDDSCEERICIHGYENFTNGNIKFYDCENVSVEGVLFRNSAIWCVNIFHSFNVTVDNVKIFGQWRYNTDGVDIVNSRNIMVKNSFIHSFDDSISIKGIDRYIHTDNCNIDVENCVLWCDWGKAFDVGIETACREYKNITFKSSDIIRAGSFALGIHNGDCAEISDITFENINVEYNFFDNIPVLQESDEHIYDDYDKKHIPFLISIENKRFRNDFYCDDIWGVPKQHAPIDLDGINESCVHDIRIQNINVYYDEKISKVDGRYNVPVEIYSCFEGVEFYNITVKNIRINGNRVTKCDIISDIKGIKNFVFE